MQSSFSSFEKVQVEYTRTPPGFSIPAACFSISRCRSAHKATFSGLHCASASGSFRNIPSPEQGASTTILSKNSGKNIASPAGLSLVTTQFVTPILSIFWDRILLRFETISLDTNMPPPASLPAICVDFPPGAAHTSSTTQFFGKTISLNTIALDLS